MILGIGSDIVAIARIERLARKHGGRGLQLLQRRVLNANEIKQISNSSFDLQIRHVAVRWAIKEATYKAVYPYLKPTWKQITVETIGTGKPVAFFHTDLLSQSTLPTTTATSTKPAVHLHVSATHDMGLVFATAIAESG